MKLFGTDGIRGEAGVAPLDPQTIARVGAALVRVHGGARPARAHRPRHARVGRMDRAARWLAGWRAGAEVVSAGVMPTPAVAYLTKADGFDLGVVISASHNPYRDNGIKVFSGAGEKFGEAEERAVEAHGGRPAWRVAGGGRRRPRPRPDRSRATSTHLRRCSPDAGPLAGARIAVDCANGATSDDRAGAVPRPRVRGRRRSASSRTARNINLDCGSTHLRRCRRGCGRRRAARRGVRRRRRPRAVRRSPRPRGRRRCRAAHLRRAAAAATARLAGDAVVATVMSNIGLEIALRDRGIALVRARSATST